MSSNAKAACLLLALLAGSSQNAYSANCYTVVGRDNFPIYSATQPLFPLAGQDWTDGQERLRVAGQYLFWFDTPACPNQALTPSTSAGKGKGDVAELSPKSRRSARTSATR